MKLKLSLILAIFLVTTTSAVAAKWDAQNDPHGEMRRMEHPDINTDEGLGDYMDDHRYKSTAGPWGVKELETEIKAIEAIKHFIGKSEQISLDKQYAIYRRLVKACLAQKIYGCGNLYTAENISLLNQTLFMRLDSDRSKLNDCRRGPDLVHACDEPPAYYKALQTKQNR